MSEWRKELIFLKGFAKGKGYNNLLKAIHCADVEHSPVTRKGGLPYVTHPVRCANALLTLGIEDEMTLSIMVLHDVPEDHDVSPQKMQDVYRLPYNIIKGTEVLNKRNYKDGDTAGYYKAIKEFGAPTILAKIADRCHNVSTMAGVFTPEKIKAYIEETEQYVLPMCREAVRTFPEYSNAFYTMRYHIESTLHACRVLVSGEKA